MQGIMLTIRISTLTWMRDSAYSGHLQDLFNRGDTDTFWKIYWEILEGSIVHFTSSELLADCGSYLGRGTNLVKTIVQTPLYNKDLGGQLLS